MPYLNRLLRHAQNDFIQRATFLQCRSDMHRSIYHLTVSQLSFRYIRDITTIFAIVEERNVFFAQLYKAVIATLPLLTSLRTLTLHRWKLTEEFYEQFQHLPRLHTLTLQCCVMIGPVPLPNPPLPSVLNLNFVFEEELHYSSYKLLYMCPNVQTMSALVPNFFRESIGLQVPLADFHSGINPFKTLRKYHFSYMSPNIATHLAAWIRAARDESPDRRIPLTHLKIGFDGGISRDQIFYLLHALNGCCVEHFILDGIRYAEPDLLDWIAQVLPELRELFLMYRSCDIQYRAQFIDWPRPSWEYASHFVHFKKLQYFAWNYRDPVSFGSVSLLYFEQNDFTNPVSDEHVMWLGDCILAKAFWSYCPTLEYYMICAFIDIAFYHRKDCDGSVRFTPDIDSKIEQRNPMVSWPPCYPSKAI